ncbi:MAG TPA: methyl-accepting chemotaxis protein [Xanthobacteraceae bacterium]|nr:methyl-accepting chemotaxis protein [Xanthobacteraceae bacterium]
MSIRHKLLLAFSLVVLLAAGVAAYGFQLISTESGLVIDVYDGPMMAVNYARTAQLSFANARRLLEAAIVLHEASSARDLAVIDQSMKQLATDLGVVKERMAGAAGYNEEIDKVLPLANDWHKAGMDYLKRDSAGVTQLLLPQAVIAKGKAVGEALDLVVENASAYGFNFRSAAEATTTESKRNLIILGLASVVAGLGMAVVMAASFSRPIRHAMAVSEEIASGNFSMQIPTKRRDELGRLLTSLDKTRASLDEMERNKERERAEQLAILRAQVEDERQKKAEAERQSAVEQARSAKDMTQLIELLGQGLSRLSHGDLTIRLDEAVAEDYIQLTDDFNSTVDRLADTVFGIISATNDVTNAAVEIASNTTDLSQRTEEQAAGLAETVASLQELGTAVKKNAESAQRASDFALKMRDVADESTEVVRNAVQAMSKIDDSSHQISEIISVIDEIARQTNLLALNAAVEAARAGDAGRGFAVVASEVRNLAQRSAQAAKDIKNLIGSSSNLVKDGVDLVNHAGAALEQIVESIRQTSTAVAEIAATSTQQAQGIDQVNKALAQLDEVTQQNSALVEENAASAKSLEQQSGEMVNRVAFSSSQRSRRRRLRASARRPRPGSKKKKAAGPARS